MEKEYVSGGISKWKQLALAYNVWGFLLGFLSIFLGKTNLSALIGLLYPLLGIILMKCSPGIIKMAWTNKKSEYHGIALGFFVPVIMMVVISLDYNIMSKKSVLLPLIVIMVLMFLLIYFTGFNKAGDSIKNQLLLIIFLTFIYSIGIVITVNCQFDSSVPNLLQPMVLKKYTTSGKGPHYHIDVASWVASNETEHIAVRKIYYEELEIGQTVKVQLKKGLLNIPWYYVLQ
ncbi:hypothetical protein IDJ77_10095 [Mucilaginibacter sp. ZT4R22]|uniref:Uncharacterized protein n=1 Tax=Mucilaginibacter pankratovii TaxID=2772110 RepID=A0ABR7WS06_9SPHI|nr:hypothetical protein [Mucilaginibacter pankratovii]MBD1364159.1 hypothetical protein [Mucilaginibacter pankratovii]